MRLLYTQVHEVNYTRQGVFNTESYSHLPESQFLSVLQNPLSTFAIDVDTASYANIRRFLREGRVPPKDALRIEEMINDLNYDYPSPTEEESFSVSAQVVKSPWRPGHRLLSLGLNGKEIVEEERQPSNLVFLLDVSRSMDMPNKLPLLKRAMKLLVNKLREMDRVAIVVYAGASGLVLPSTALTR